MLAADLSGGGADPSFGHAALGQTGGPTGSISGSVFATASVAGCDSQSAGDSMADVRVQLLDETGRVIEESNTDGAGSYRFSDLVPGQYAVRQLRQHGYFEGTSLVGDGGGIALGSNLVGEIVIQAGETLGGYDFCKFASHLEPAGPTDRPIVPHDRASQVLPFQTLSLRSSPVTLSEIYAEPMVESVADTRFVATFPLDVSRPAEVYGGSSRSLKKSAEIKAWQDDPFDTLFSTTSFFDLARAELPRLETFEPILGVTEESRDLSLADGHTANPLDWWEDGARLELDPLIGDAEITVLRPTTL